MPSLFFISLIITLLILIPVLYIWDRHQKKKRNKLHDTGDLIKMLQMATKVPASGGIKHLDPTSPYLDDFLETMRGQPLSRWKFFVFSWRRRVRRLRDKFRRGHAIPIGRGQTASVVHFDDSPYQPELKIEKPLTKRQRTRARRQRQKLREKIAKGYMK